MSTGIGSSPERAWRPVANQWLIAIVVMLAASMEVLDATIVNVSLPHISGTMLASYDQSTWVLTSYLVASGIVLPISAFFARLFGRKRYFTICIVAFMICSLLCGIATELWQLILFRVLQGFFGGGLQPTAQAIILDTFEPSQRGKAFAITGVAIVVAPILGPTLGGWITDSFSWRWVFLINVPLGIVMALAVSQLVEDPPWQKQARESILGIDYVGIALIALGLGCLQVMLDRGQDADWFSSPFIRTIGVLAAVGLTGAVAWLVYAKRPVLDLRCLLDRNFVLGTITIAAFSLILYASEVLIPRFAQQQLGYTAMRAGLVLSPGALLVLVLIPVIVKTMDHVQTRYLLAFGFFLLGSAMFYSHHLVPDIDYRTLVLMRTAQSIGIGFLFVPASTLTYLTLPQRLNADGTALFAMFLNVAGSLGISLSTSMLTYRTQVHMAYLSEHMSTLSQPYNDALQGTEQVIRDLGSVAGDATSGALAHLYQTLIAQSAVLGYLDVFAACAIFAWLFIPLMFLFPPVKAAGIVRH
jgi:DHA2 family multidrug resistance protein